MLNQLIDGISIKIDSEFGEGYTIYTEGIEQGFDEPCFFILLLKSTANQIIGRRYSINNSFDVHYFPSTENKNQEMLDVAERLKDVLEQVTMSGDFVRGTKMQYEVVNGVLHFFVEYNFHVIKQDDNPIDSMDVLTTTSQLKE